MDAPKKRGRKPKAEKVAEHYQVRLENARRAVGHELARGNLHAALRLVLGFAEDVAMRSDSAEAVYMLQFERRLYGSRIGTTSCDAAYVRLFCYMR